MAFQCTVVTPEQQVLDEKVSQVVLTAHDGEIGILTDRAPLLVKLGVGPLRVDPVGGGGRRVFLIDGGVAQMKDNKLTVLTQSALLPETLDRASATAEYEQALTRTATDEKSANERQHAISRARAKQQMAKK